MPRSPNRPRAVVVGAGLGGLAAAVALSIGGVEVSVLEAHDRVGGKLRQLEVAGRSIDVGPTVLTMPDVLEKLFDDAGASLSEYLELIPLSVLARHHWADGAWLDLFSDRQKTATAIEAMAGTREAAGYLRFCAYAERMLGALEQPFIRSPAQGLFGMIRSMGVDGMRRMAGVDWRRTMWRALPDFFTDPRLRQLFARYATYTGSSPMAATATLNLVAAVEQRGVYAVAGGMARIAESLATLATRLGVSIHCGCPVRSLLVEGGRCRGVMAGDTLIAADVVVFNGDPTALTSGLLGSDVRQVVAPIRPSQRSLSAFTLALVGRATGRPLTRHNVLFSRDYEKEFRELQQGRVPQDPTVYLCAQDRVDSPRTGESSEERLFALINAPPCGDDGRWSQEESDECKKRILARIRQAQIELSFAAQNLRATDSAEFARLFPGSGGALYGRATTGWLSPFRRGGARTKLPGLYQAGGSVHPGAGVPMVILSGGFAASQALVDLHSTRTWVPVATSGGMSTASPTTAGMPLP